MPKRQSSLISYFEKRRLVSASDTSETDSTTTAATSCDETSTSCAIITPTPATTVASTSCDETSTSSAITKSIPATPTIASDVSHHRDPDDLSQKGEPPKQTIISFPKTGDRKFSSHWYKQFQWLEYSVHRDAVFCQPCRLFGSHHTATEIFVKKVVLTGKK